MNENIQLLLIVIGLVMIAGLVWLIRQQLKTQRDAREAHAQLVAEHEAKAQEQRDYLIDSVRVIAQAMQEDQCELAEGCIRLKRLLDHLAPHLHQHQDYSVINEMFEATKHMPILDEWKQLKIKRRMELTLEREALEKEYRPAILAAAGRLTRYRFEQ